jgi:hypothetical protein
MWLEAVATFESGRTEVTLGSPTPIPGDLGSTIYDTPTEWSRVIDRENLKVEMYNEGEFFYVWFAWEVPKRHDE